MIYFGRFSWLYCRQTLTGSEMISVVSMLLVKLSSGWENVQSPLLCSTPPAHPELRIFCIDYGILINNSPDNLWEWSRYLQHPSLSPSSGPRCRGPRVWCGQWGWWWGASAPDCPGRSRPRSSPEPDPPQQSPWSPPPASWVQCLRIPWYPCYQRMQSRRLSMDWCLSWSLETALVELNLNGILLLQCYQVKKSAGKYCRNPPSESWMQWSGQSLCL